MRKLMLCLMLAGCATTTQQRIQAEGVRFEHRSANPPYRAASCVSSNLEEALGYPATLREHSTAGAYEVSARYPGGVMAYAIAAPSGAGSTITLWISPMNVYRESIARKIGGC